MEVGDMARLSGRNGQAKFDLEGTSVLSLMVDVATYASAIEYLTAMSS